MAIKHTFVSAVANGADATLVRPSNWNAEHTIDIPINKNVIINGGFDIWQRRILYAAIPHGGITADRFVQGVSAGNTVWQQEQSTDIPNNRCTYSLKISCNNGDTALEASDVDHLRYAVEGYDLAKLIDKEVTLSFWVKSSLIGIYCAAFIANDAVSYVAEYTINVANTWEFKTVTLTLNQTAQAWNRTNGCGVKIRWTFRAGSTYQTTANAWNAGNFMATANQVNFAAAANTFYLTQVQLEPGSVATPFEFRPYQQELVLCMRYYRTIRCYPALAMNTTTVACLSPLSPPMRTTPTLSISAALVFTNYAADYTQSSANILNSYVAADSLGFTANNLTITAAQLLFGHSLSGGNTILSAEF